MRIHFGGFAAIVLTAALYSASAEACPSKYDPTTPQGRHDLARELLDMFARLDNAVPVPTPEDRAWLETELESRDGHRLAKTWGSVIYKKMEAKRFASLLHQAARHLVEMTGTGAEDDDPPGARAALEWTRIATLLVDQRVVQTFVDLHEAGKISLDRAMPIVRRQPVALLPNLCEAWATTLLRSFTLPHLERAVE